jgi:hypothetical protein
MWTRRLTVIGGQTDPDDWIVRRDGRDVGRVIRGRNHPAETPWSWCSWPAKGWSRHGYVTTMDEALEAVRRAVIEDEDT